jgi:hypothetical protein
MPAHAARVPLTSKTLFASKSTADALPSTLVQDAFTASNGTLLASRSATTGQPWNVVSATLSIDSNRLRCSTCSSSYGAALVDGDLPVVNASVNLRLANSGTAGAAGIVLNATSTGSSAFVAWWDAGTVRLQKYSGGTFSTVASAAGGALSRTSDAALSVTATGTRYTVTFKGSTVITYTLSAADIATFGANTYFGVAFEGDPDVLRIDDFTVTR